MDCPRHIEDSASQLFYQDKTTLEYRALLAVSTLPHPQRPILAAFVLAARDHEAAAQFLLSETANGDPEYLQEFLTDWMTLTSRCKMSVHEAPD